MNKKEILNELLNILKKYLKINIIFGENYEEDRLLFSLSLNIWYNPKVCRMKLKKEILW